MLHYKSKFFVKFLWRSRRRPQHRLVHGGGWQGDNHSILIPYAADGLAISYFDFPNGTV